MKLFLDFNIPIKAMFLMVAILPIFSCQKSSSSGGKEQFSSNLEGIYKLSEWLENKENCESEGSSVLENAEPQYFFLKMVSYAEYNFSVLEMVHCLSVENCKELALKFEKKENFSSKFMNAFNSGNDQDGFTGETTTTGFSSGANCTEGSYSTHTLKQGTGASKSVIFTDKSIVADPFPKDAEGFCTTSNTRKAIEGKSCSEITTITGIFQETL